ncbi:hypothetical protein, partial [Streptococcus suis]|uniref:hypothetical protein n=1 Tax=Streptococcus suis TaxID=1307 RepID=UPI00370C99DF
RVALKNAASDFALVDLVDLVTPELRLLCENMEKAAGLQCAGLLPVRDTIFLPDSFILISDMPNDFVSAESVAKKVAGNIWVEADKL